MSSPRLRAGVSAARPNPANTLLRRLSPSAKGTATWPRCAHPPLRRRLRRHHPASGGAGRSGEGEGAAAAARRRQTGGSAQSTSGTAGKAALQPVYAQAHDAAAASATSHILSVCASSRGADVATVGPGEHPAQLRSLPASTTAPQRPSSAPRLLPAQRDQAWAGRCGRDQGAGMDGIRRPHRRPLL